MTELNVALSRDVKQNAHLHYCQSIGHFKYYAVCLNLIDRNDSPVGLPAIYCECESLIKKKSCPALKMRKEEIAENKPIYFVQRQTSDEWAKILEQKERYKPARVSKTTEPALVKEQVATPPPEMSDEDRFLNGGIELGDVINNVLSSSKIEGSSVTRESLLEMAQRLMRNQNGNSL